MENSCAMCTYVQVLEQMILLTLLSVLYEWQIFPIPL